MEKLVSTFFSSDIIVNTNNIVFLSILWGKKEDIGNMLANGFRFTNTITNSTDKIIISYMVKDIR